MSNTEEPQHYVTRAEMQDAIKALEDRIQKRTEVFVTEIRGLMGQMRDERNQQYHGLIDSNRSMSEATVTTRTALELMTAEMQRALNSFDRNADGVAARLTTLERLAAKPRRPASRRKG